LPLGRGLRTKKACVKRGKEHVRRDAQLNKKKSGEREEKMSEAKHLFD